MDLTTIAAKEYFFFSKYTLMTFHFCNKLSVCHIEITRFFYFEVDDCEMRLHNPL